MEEELKNIKARGSDFDPKAVAPFEGGNLKGTEEGNKLSFDEVYKRAIGENTSASKNDRLLAAAGVIGYLGEIRTE